MGRPGKRKEKRQAKLDLTQQTPPALPTPAMSSQVQGRSGRVKRKREGKQSTIDFGGHTGFRLKSERIAELSSPPSFASSSAAQPTSTMFAKARSVVLNATQGRISSESEAEEDAPLASSARSPRALRQKMSRHAKAGRIKTNEGRLEGSSRPQRRVAHMKPAIVISDDEEDVDPEDVSINGEEDGSRRKVAGEVDIGEAETSGDEVMVSSPPAKRSRSSVQPSRFEQVKSSNDRAKQRKRYHVLEDDGFVVGDGEVEEDDVDDEDEPVQPSSSRKHRVLHSSPSPSGSDEGDSPTKRRRLTQGIPRTSLKSRQEKADLAEDLQHLGSSMSPSKLRSSTTAKQDARAEALREFKRRRAGESHTDAALPKPKEQSQLRKKALYDSTDDDDDNDNDNDSLIDELRDKSDDGENAPTPDAYQVLNGHGDDEEDEWIVDDEDDEVGVPTMPVRFTGLARANGKSLFKYAVEFMVQKKINPGFEQKTDVYELTFRKLDDEARALAGSKFMSSAWKAEFARSLRNRPQIEIVMVGSDGVLDCEACGRTGHPATYEISFKGKPYDRQTLDELDNVESEGENSDSGEGDENDAPDYDHMGNVILAPSTVFHCGKTCARNAEIAHALEHWRFHLNEWVVSWLDGQGHLTPEQIVRRASRKAKKLQREALRITDTMERTGEIEMLYQTFRAEVDTAHNEKGSGYAPWNDD